MAKSKLFTSVRGKSANKQGNWLKQGQYIAKIQSCKVVESTNNDGVEYAILEMRIVKHLDEDAAAAHRIGEEVAYNWSSAHKPTPGNLLAFIGAALDTDVDSLTDDQKEEAIANVFGDEDPLAGMAIEVHAKVIKTKKDNDFTTFSCKGEVLPSTIFKVVDQETIDRLWPDGALEKAMKELEGDKE